MTGSKYMLRTALPGLSAGTLGLLAGLLGLLLDLPALAALAGVLALAAGLASVLVARQMDDQLALHAIVDSELRTDRILGQAGAALPLPDPSAPTAPSTSSTSSTPAAPGPSSADTGHPAGRGGNTSELSTGPEPTGEALMDRTTGLFSEDFFRVALESRIAAARRHLRPIAVVLIEVVEGLPSGEPRAVEADLVSGIIRNTLREADTACRLRSGYFALLLEDTPENGAIWTVERMRRQLSDTRSGLTIWAGVACYPAHAFTPDEILGAAEGALVSAREWRQDRIEVAVAAD